MKIIFLICWVSLLAGCLSPGRKNELPDDEYAVINTVLKATIPADTGFKKSFRYLYSPVRFPPPYPAGYTKQQMRADSQAWAKRTDSIKRRLDTARLYVFINDSLAKFPPGYLKNIAANSMAGIKAMYFKNPAMVKRIAMEVDTDTKPTILRRDAVARLAHYQTVFYKRRIALPKHLLTPGLFAVSRVCFNKERSLACVYTDSYCGMLCGSGNLFFLVKKGDRWVIADTRMVWVA